MNEAVAASPLSAARSKSAAWPAHSLVVLLAALACVLMLATSLFWREAYTGDEGFYGVTGHWHRR